MASQSIDEEAVFNVARNIECLAAREDYLEQICGTDTALKARVKALLDAWSQDSKFMNSPPSWLDATVDVEPISECVGTVVGKYKLMEQIGEGGMGLVFVAEQQRPIRRKVAVKIIKPGMDSREVIARFEAERQALALMDHPNVAKVLDAGTTESGRPYFVMELVKGISITDYCDRNKLTTSQRLNLFVTVCEAVQHAHQKGIIHRDIKPSNVLVTEHDGRPVVKIIDFGVAKAINQRLTEQTIYTRFQQMVGTPMYMSPEQAELSGLDVDTRSDIYSLGVLLYELLTGEPPFERNRFAKAAFDELRRIIREEEPPRPSTRVSTLGDAATDVSIRRQTDPGTLSQVLRGEIDWIVMKALDKDRTRRYESASSFAEDVERYLNNETVSAYPPTWTYRLRKVIRRNRGPVFAATLLVLALIGGLIGTSIGLLRARSAAIAEQKAWDEKEKVLSESAAAKERERQLELSKQVALATADGVRGTSLLDQQDSVGLHWLDRALKRLTSDAPLRQELEAQIAEAIVETPQVVAAWTNDDGVTTRVLQAGQANFPDRAFVVVETEGDDGHATLSSIQPIDIMGGAPIGNAINGRFDPKLHRSLDGDLLVTVDAMSDGDNRRVRFWNGMTGVEVSPPHAIDSDTVVLGISGDSSLVLAKERSDQEFEIWFVEHGSGNKSASAVLAYPKSWKGYRDRSTLANMEAYAASKDYFVVHTAWKSDPYVITVEGDHLQAESIEGTTQILINEGQGRIIKLTNEERSPNDQRAKEWRIHVRRSVLDGDEESDESFAVDLTQSPVRGDLYTDASQSRILFSHGSINPFQPVESKKMIEVIDLSSEKIILHLEFPPPMHSRHFDARISSDGTFVVVVQRTSDDIGDNIISVYDVKTKELKYHQVHVNGDVIALGLSADNHTLTAYTESGGRTWLLPNTTVSPSLSLPVADAMAADVDSDKPGQHIYYASTDRNEEDGSYETNIEVWDIASKTLVKEHALGSAVSHNLGEFDSQSGLYVATNSDKSTVSLWDCETGELLARVQNTAEGVNAATLSPDRRTLITLAFPFVDEDHVSELEVWEIPSGQKRQSVRLPFLFRKQTFGGYGWIRFSAAGDAVFVGGGDGFLKVPFRDGELTEGEARWADGDERIAGAYGNTQKPVAISEIGNWLLLASDDAFRRWDGETLKPLTVYQEKRNFFGMRKCRISPDGTLVAFEWGVKVRVWDAESGQLIQDLIHPAAVTNLRFSRDRKTLMTCCEDGLLRLWPLDSARPVHADDMVNVVTRVTGYQLVDDGDDLKPMDIEADAGLIEAANASQDLIDQALSRIAADEWGSARYLLTLRIRREPHDSIAYLLRARAHFHLGSGESAALDVDRAVAEATKVGDLGYLLQWAKCYRPDPEFDALVLRTANAE